MLEALIGDGGLDTGGTSSASIGIGATDAAPKKSGTPTKELLFDAKGKLPPEVVRRVLRLNLPKLRACYEQALKKDKTAQGAVKLLFSIDPKGKVETASSGGGTLADTTAVACMLSVIRALSFPEPDGGKVIVAYVPPFEPS